MNTNDRQGIIPVQYIFVFTLLFASLLSMNAVAAEGPGQLCKQDEEILFGFQMEKTDKFVAFCVNKKADYIVYRFGTAKKVELEFPKEAKDSWNKFSYENEGSSCTTRVGQKTALLFQNGNIRYRVQQFCNLAPPSPYDEDNGDMKVYLDLSIEVRNVKTGKSTILSGRETNAVPLRMDPGCEGIKFLNKIRCEKDKG